MSASSFFLSVNGGAASRLTDLGIRGAVLEKASLDVGSFRFSVAQSDVTDAIPYTYGTTLQLISISSEVLFVGRVRQISKSADAKNCFYTIVAFDSWWEMERTVYRQPSAIYQPSGTLIGYLSTRVTLNQDAWGAAIPQGKQIQNAAVLASYVNPGIMSVASAPPDGNTMPVEETRDVTIAEVIRRAASLTPGFMQYSDYSAAIWSQVYRTRGSLTLAILDMNPAYSKVASINGLRPLTEAIPVGVVFDFLSTLTLSTGATQTRLYRQTAGNPGAFNTIYATFNLPSCSVAPGGAAAAYYNSLLIPHWVGTITLKEDECSGSVRMGNRLRIANGFAEWATMDAFVRRTTEELDTGTTTLELGPPDALQVSDFIDQMTRFRNRPAPNGFCLVQNNNDKGTDDGVDDTGAVVPPPDGTGGSEAGVTGPATGPTGAGTNTNPNAGAPAGGGMTGGKIAYLDTCSGTTIAVLTP